VLASFYVRLNQFLRDNCLNFRNIVNMYYDYSFLQKASDEVSSELLKQLKQDPKLLSPFITLQLLQASSRSYFYKSFKELQVADFVIRNLKIVLDELDPDQKCIIFKYIACLEFCNNYPRFRTPQELYILNQLIKEKLDQVSESSVINIVIGF